MQQKSLETEGVDWDKRYREGFYDGARDPHGLLQKYWHLFPRGPVVDIAMGNGRDAIFLSHKGLKVYGLERSREAIRIAMEAAKDAKSNISVVMGDANALPFRGGSVSGIIIFYFLLRHTMTEIESLLRQGGILMYETFLKRQNTIDRWRNPEYLLDDGELLRYFENLDILFYEEVVSYADGKGKAVARLVGRRK